MLNFVSGIGFDAIFFFFCGALVLHILKLLLVISNVIPAFLSPKPSTDNIDYHNETPLWSKLFFLKLTSTNNYLKFLFQILKYYGNNVKHEVIVMLNICCRKYVHRFYKQFSNSKIIEPSL